ncbi:MAG: hypothetical protein AAF728_01275 [Cyanobacteria bacterium P01_D01_bin.128]
MPIRPSTLIPHLYRNLTEAPGVFKALAPIAIARASAHNDFQESTMLTLHRPFALLSLSLGVLIASPAIAQTQRVPELFQQGSEAAANDSAEFTASTNTGETLYLAPNQVVEYSLRLSAPATLGGRRLEAGSVIRGQFEPVSGGLRYVATGAESSDRIYTFTAASDTLHDVKDPRETSTGAILGDAAIGAAGGVVLGEVFGNADAVEIIGGAAAGVIVGNVTAQRVVVLEPNQVLTLVTQF